MIGATSVPRSSIERFIAAVWSDAVLIWKVYEPNSFGGAVKTRSFMEPALDLYGPARFDHREGNDDFSQPRALCSIKGRRLDCSPTLPLL